VFTLEVSRFVGAHLSGKGNSANDKGRNMKAHFQMFAAYNQWANAALYGAAAQLPVGDYKRDRGAFFKSVHGTLNHILVADRIWMKRFTGEGDAPKQLSAIICDDLQELTIVREREDARIVKWIAGMDAKAFAGRFSYMTVTDMRTVSQRLAPALAHLFNHQTHHRGQAHALLTGFGMDAPSLDLIYFQRSEEGRKWA
jgi:uncharacterized damage-inducible protein DinB